MTSSPAALPPEPPAWPAWSGTVERLAPPPAPGATAAALAWLEALGERAGWPPRALMALTLCADEALANVALHARTPGGEPARLWLACGPTAQESPALATSLDEAHVGGHGLRLMRHYLHRMLYRRIPDRNVLLLEVAL